MSVKNETEYKGIQAVGRAVAMVLQKMKEAAKPGLSTADLDLYGGRLLKETGAVSAPKKTYGFPGYTCISLNHEIAHGIPSKHKILKDGDLINIDVSAELNGFWADNGASFVVGKDINNHSPLIEISKKILMDSIALLKPGLPINSIGAFIHKQANLNGYKVIRNLAGHGVGRSLHEHPLEILNYDDGQKRGCITHNMVLAIETFIATESSQAVCQADNWTLTGNRGGYVAQHEHTVMVGQDDVFILTDLD